MTISVMPLESSSLRSRCDARHGVWDVSGFRSRLDHATQRTHRHAQRCSRPNLLGRWSVRSGRGSSSASRVAAIDGLADSPGYVRWRYAYRYPVCCPLLLADCRSAPAHQRGSAARGTECLSCSLRVHLTAALERPWARDLPFAAEAAASESH
jgi:hypothetical protein